MKSLRYLNKYLWKYKWRLFLGVVFMTGSNWFGVEMPMIVKRAVDDFLYKIKGSQDMDFVLHLCFSLAGMYILFSIIKGIFLFLTRQMIIVMSRHIEFDLKNEIYAHYQKLSFGFFKRNRTGDLMNRISEDVGNVRMYLGPGLMYTINLAVLFVLVVVAMLKINVALTLIVLTPLPLMSVLINRVSNKMNKLSKAKQEEQSHLATITQETFSGIRVIKAYLREREMSERFVKSSNEYKSRSMKLVLVNSLFMPTISFLIGLSILLTVYFGGLYKYTGEVTPGDIIAFVQYVFMLTWPFASVGWVTAINQRAAASQSRINEFLEEVPEIINSAPDKQLTAVQEIRFDQVSFRYADAETDVIHELSFSVRSGETLGIVGRTGSGKSTILNLLTRQLDVTSGQVFVDGQDIRRINLDAYRRQTGVVPQDVFLFSDTIRNNISFGSSDVEVPEEQLVAVSKAAHVYHNIMDFPDGFDTLLGERGVNLSGGQKQRVSIARALLRKPQVLLLDDCLSAVDTETEDVILTQLAKDYADQISVIVSHRVSSLRFADKIIVIEAGKKVEEGTHDSLLEAGGLYADMYHKQLADAE